MSDLIELLLNKFLNFIVNTYWLNVDLLAISFLLSTCMAISVMLLELVYVEPRDSSFFTIFFRRSKSTSTDLFFFVLHASGLVTLFAVLTSFGVPQAISTIIKSIIGFDIGFQYPPIVHLAAYLILADLMNYWQHRLMHEVPALWEIHRFHHSAEEFNVVTVFREHPLDKALNSVFMILPGIILGSPVGDFALFITVYGLIGYVKHSRLPWHGFVGKYVIQSPTAHKLHHSKSEAHHNSNYANNFAIWDHVFGTYQEAEGNGVEIGLYDNDLNKTNAVNDALIIQVNFMRRLYVVSKSVLKVELNKRN